MNEQSQNVGAHNTGQGPTGGDSANGAPQVESGGDSRSSEFHVNQAFIDQYGPEAGQALKRVIEGVSDAGHGTDIVAIRAALKDGLDRAGIEMPPVEADKMADRIARSQHVNVDATDLHAGQH